MQERTIGEEKHMMDSELNASTNSRPQASVEVIASGEQTAAVQSPLSVPSLWCSFPERIHPQWQEMEAATRIWMERYGLAPDSRQQRRFAAIGCGELGGRVVEPDAKVPWIQFSSDQILWLFAFDDTYCDEGAYSHNPAGMALLVAKMLRIAETGTSALAHTPLERALCDLRCRLEAIALPIQRTRWMHAMRAYLSYQVWEAAYRANHTIPSLDDYLTTRISNGGMPVCSMSLDIASGFVVPAADMENPSVRALTEMCGAIVGFDNDLLSHWKETLRNGDGINLIDVLAVHSSCTSHEALSAAVVLRDRVLNRYIALRNTIWTTLRPEARRYVLCLDAWIRGNLDWGMKSDRYLNTDIPANLPNMVAVSPTTMSADLLPYPSIAWWWKPELEKTHGSVQP